THRDFTRRIVDIRRHVEPGADRNGDVLATFDLIGDRNATDGRRNDRFKQHFAVFLVVSAEATVGVATEQQATLSSEQRGSEVLLIEAPQLFTSLDADGVEAADNVSARSQNVWRQTDVVRQGHGLHAEV